jgi:HK97 family phage major capsid protein
MNLQEQLRAFQQKRADAVERQTQIMSAAAEEGRTLDDEESGEYDGITKEVGHVEAHIKRLELLIDGDRRTAEPTEKSRGPTIIVKRTDPDDEFLGQSFVRRVIAKAIAEMSQGETTAVEVAKSRWGKTHPNLVEWIAKAAVAGGITHTSAAWAANLVQSDNRFTGDFIEFLKAQTIYDRLPLREIPAHVTVKGQDGIAAGYWVGEGRPIPVSAQEFSSVGLKPLKVAAISVITNELILHSSPSAEMLVRDGLAEAITQRVDQTFLGDDIAVANVSPAGLLRDVTAISSSGTTAEALRADINALYAQFLAERNASGLHFVTSPSLAKQIGLMRNALGQTDFPGLGAMGGTLEGDPLHTGDNVYCESDGTHLILLKPSDIYRIGDTGVQVSLSRDATIEQATDPRGRADTGFTASQSIVSMFQTESTAFKVVRSINYAKRRTNAVQYISDADYGAVTSD